MLTETETEIVPPTTEGLKAAWQRLAPQVPEGCKMILYFEGHYGLNDLCGKPWEYVGEKWRVNLTEEIKGGSTYASGDGPTPDAAMTKATGDLYSKRAGVRSRELAEFKEWRAARERAGKSKPHDPKDWDRAVAQGQDDEDADND
jgi:hypothetical protein